MGTLRRYGSALKRYRQSLGFGVHSPFAFSFIRGVLAEKSPYYAYERLAKARRLSLDMANNKGRHRRVISLKSAKLLFRVTCRFNPAFILQCGASYGVSSVAMLEVDSSSRLMVYTGSDVHDEIYTALTMPFEGRVTRYATLEDAAKEYLASLNGHHPFMLVNDTCGCIGTLRPVMTHILDKGGVIVMRNLDRPDMDALWKSTLSAMKHGMSFSNGRVGIITALPHLPCQHFSLWF